MKYVFLIAALASALSVATTPSEALAQSNCSRPNEPAESVEVRTVGSWFLELSVWPSKHIFTVEMRPVRPTTEQGQKLVAKCFAGEALPDDATVSAVQFQNADFSGGSVLRIRIFWADHDHGTPQGKAGDIVAARCSPEDLQSQTGKCNTWRKLGGWFRLTGNWPPDWR